MFENVKVVINELVDLELNRRREELIKKAKINTMSIESIGLLDLDIKELDKCSHDIISEGVIKNFFPNPHISFKVPIDEGYPEEGSYSILAWVNKDLNTGVVMSEEDEGAYEIGTFKVHKRGKYGRGVKAYSMYCSEKEFLKHYDDFIADVILLGLDETLTESKEP
jgi:hypothetical protein